MLNSNELSENDLRHKVVRKAAREHFLDYCIATDKRYDPQWFHREIARRLEEVYERVLRGESPRLMIFMPPRHGKSEISTKKFPSWVLGKSPEFPIITSTYSQDLSNKFGQGTRDILFSRNYQGIFDTRLREDSTAKASWMTTEGGGYEAVGVGGPITGKGFKIGIIDDPFKNDEEAESEIIRDKVHDWYKTTFYTRQEGNAAIVLINTRWHDDDLSGRLLKEEEESRASNEAHFDTWEVINFAAIAEKDDAFRKEGEALWPGKFPKEQLERTKKALGPYKWSALYQQNPVDIDAQEFKQSWFKKRPLEEVRRLNTRRYLTIDPASAMRGDSDNIGATLNFVDSQNKWNLMTWKLRMNSSELINFMFTTYAEYGFEKCGIEEGAYQQVVKPFLDAEMRKRNVFFPVEELKHNQMMKQLRIRGLIPYYASDSVFHIEGMCQDLEDELLRFPKGAHDDVADSAAYQPQIISPPIPADSPASPLAPPYYGDRDVNL